MSSGYSDLLQDHWERITNGSDGQGTSTGSNLKPFFVIDRNDENAVLTWLSETLTIIEDAQIDRATNQVNNVNFYNGLQRYMTGNGRDMKQVRSSNGALGKDAYFVMNHARDFVNQSVSRLSRYSANINVFPVNNEYGDRIGARYSKRVIDNVFLINEAPQICVNSLLEGKLCGESFTLIKYNQGLGDKSPVYEQALSQAREKAHIANKPLSNTFTNSEGEEISLDIIKRTGEVELKSVLPWFFFQEPAFKWKDVNYCFIGEIKHIDQVRAENPGIDLEAVAPIKLGKNETGTFGPGFKYGSWVIEYEFYHRGHPLLDDGWYAKFIPGKLLESRKLELSHRQLPVARFTDFDNPLDAHGVSFLEDLKPPLVLMNKMLGLMYRNVAIASHPKFMVPEGTTNIQSLANGPLIIEYTWPMKPEMVTFQGNAQDIFSVSEKIMQQTTMISGTFDSSRGGVVPNARAGSILNFYEEQEEQRESTQIKKYTAYIEKIARLALGTASDFYEPDDGRTIRVVGARNYYKVRQIKDTKKLSGPYDVRVERTTALSESKQGRIDQIVALSSVPTSSSPLDQGKPGIFSREQILRMLEVADTPTFFEMATAAVEKQESENEDMFEGIQVPPPEKWEAHVVAWNVIFQFLQSREFTDTRGVPPEVKEMVLDHMLAHEVFMYEKAEKSLAFAQELMLNTNYPAVLDLGMKPSINQLVMIHQMPPAPPMPMMPPPMGPEAGASPPGQPEDQIEPMPEAEMAQPDALDDAAPAPNAMPDQMNVQ